MTDQTNRKRTEETVVTSVKARMTPPDRVSRWAQQMMTTVTISPAHGTPPRVSLRKTLGAILLWASPKTMREVE